jgi:hypothetical protein
MNADLFRISLSREVDRSRYLTAILSPRRPVTRRVPDCLRPEREVGEDRLSGPGASRSAHVDPDNTVS